MSEWAPKRFWTDVSVEEDSDGYSVRLDGRPVRTPAKRHLVLPTRPLADSVAAEWEAQEEKVDPLSMPWTRSANAALDKVASQRDEVMAHLIEYAGSDLLCYRAEAPDELVERQENTWKPILDWVEEMFDARLRLTAGVMPIPQERAAIDRLQAPMHAMSDFHLTGFHDMVALSGSYAIALAAAAGQFPVESLWSASRVDENWQIEQWGEDSEAKREAENKKVGFLHATELFSAAGKISLTS